jgi:hypothetical protein
VSPDPLTACDSFEHFSEGAIRTFVHIGHHEPLAVASRPARNWVDGNDRSITLLPAFLEERCTFHG